LAFNHSESRAGGVDVLFEFALGDDNIFGDELGQVLTEGKDIFSFAIADEGFKTGEV